MRERASDNAVARLRSSVTSRTEVMVRVRAESVGLREITPLRVVIQITSPLDRMAR